MQSGLDTCDPTSQADHPVVSKGGNLPVKRKVTLYRKKSVEQYDVYFNAVEEVVEKIGIFGSYQILCCSLTFLSVIPWFANYTQIFYAMMENSFTCVDPIDNTTIHSRSDEIYFCQIADECLNLTMGQANEVSIVTDFRLTCGRRTLTYVILVTFLIGRMAGALVGGHLSDNFGRLWGLFLLHSVGLVVRALSIASRDWIAFAVFQFITGAIFGHIQTACMTLLSESTDGPYRLIPIACSQLSGAFIVFSLISYFIKDWRMYFITISLITSPLLYGYILFEESPRWLITKKKLSDAALVITELISERWKGKGEEIHAAQLKTLPLDEEGWRKYTVKDLFHNKKMAFSTAVLLLCTISVSFVNGSLLFFGHNAMVNDYPLHMALTGLLRVLFLAIALTMSIKITRFGNRLLLLGSSVLVILGFGIVTILFYLSKHEEYYNITYVILLITTSINSSTYHLSILHTVAVIYPTVVRSIAFGFFMVFEDLGTIIIGALTEEITRAWSVLPCIIIEIVLVASLIVSIWYIPETKYAYTRKLLPNTFADCE